MVAGDESSGLTVQTHSPTVQSPTELGHVDGDLSPLNACCELRGCRSDLERFAGWCTRYPQFSNHPRASAAATAAEPSAAARPGASAVRGPTARTCPSTFDLAGSVGEKSGE